MGREKITRIKLGHYKTINHKHVIDISMFLLMAYIFFLYTAQKTLISPQVHSVVMFIFIGWTVFKVITGKRLVVITYTKWYMGLILISVVSFVWAREIVTDTLYNMFVALIITACFIITINTYEKLEMCIKTFVLSADTMGVMLCITGQVSLEVGERLGESVTGNANSFSALLMVAAVFSAWLSIYKKNKREKLFYVASLLFLLFLMGISGGRKTIIAVVACFIWFLFIKDIKNGIKTIKNIMIIGIGVYLLYLALTRIPVLYEAIGQRFESLFSFMGGGSSQVNSDNIRKRLIIIGIEGWKDSPIIGNGFDTFKYYNREITGHFYYAHNNYVEMLFDLGLLGFAYYYWFIIRLVSKFLKYVQLNRELMALGIGIIVEIFVHDIGGISYYTVMLQILLCIACITFRLLKYPK